MLSTPRKYCFGVDSMMPLGSIRQIIKLATLRLASVGGPMHGGEVYVKMLYALGAKEEGLNRLPSFVDEFVKGW